MVCYRKLISMSSRPHFFKPWHLAPQAGASWPHRSSEGACSWLQRRSCVWARAWPPLSRAFERRFPRTEPPTLTLPCSLGVSCLARILFGLGARITLPRCFGLSSTLCPRCPCTASNPCTICLSWLGIFAEIVRTFTSSLRTTARSSLCICWLTRIRSYRLRTAEWNRSLCLWFPLSSRFWALSLKPICILISYGEEFARTGRILWLFVCVSGLICGRLGCWTVKRWWTGGGNPWLLFSFLRTTTFLRPVGGRADAFWFELGVPVAWPVCWGIFWRLTIFYWRMRGEFASTCASRIFR